MNDCLQQEPFQGISLCDAEEAKYTAMHDERRSHAARQDTAWVKRADATAARMRRESQTSSRSRHEWMAA